MVGRPGLPDVEPLVDVGAGMDSQVVVDPGVGVGAGGEVGVDRGVGVGEAEVTAGPAQLKLGPAVVIPFSLANDVLRIWTRRVLNGLVSTVIGIE